MTIKGKCIGTVAALIIIGAGVEINYKPIEKLTNKVLQIYESRNQPDELFRENYRGTSLIDLQNTSLNTREKYFINEHNYQKND